MFIFYELIVVNTIACVVGDSFLNRLSENTEAKEILVMDESGAFERQDVYERERESERP